MVMICLSDIFERFWFSIWLLWQGQWLLKYNSFTFLSRMDPSITSLTLFILRRTLSTCRMIIPTLIALLWWCFVLACGGLHRSASLVSYWYGLLRPAFFVFWLWEWLTAWTSWPDMVFSCSREYSCDWAICIAFSNVNISPSAYNNNSL